jgi:hypothetical protein
MGAAGSFPVAFRPEAWPYRNEIILLTDYSLKRLELPESRCTRLVGLTYRMALPGENSRFQRPTGYSPWGMRLSSRVQGSLETFLR